MKAVIFSDIHGNQYAFRQFLNALDELEYDALIFCGDIYGYYYGQGKIISGMQTLEPLLAVRGNHDEMAIRLMEQQGEPTSEFLTKYGHSYCMMKKCDIDYVRRLPEKIELMWDGKRILVVHGIPEDPLWGRIYPSDAIAKPEEYIGYDYVICGHTHFKMFRKEGHTVILNPGSLGQQRDGKGFGYAWIDFETGAYRFLNIQFDISELEKEIDRFDYGNLRLKEILHRGSIS